MDDLQRKQSSEHAHHADTTANTSQAQVSPFSERLPSHIGRYQVLERLGAGGMGTVYRAHDPQLDRTVALKVPRFDRSRPDCDKVMQRFIREARTAACVRHPNVCPIYDAGEHEGPPYAVMACIEGASLADRFQEQKPTPEQAVELVRKIALALDAVHAEGILHRDLKPANVLLDTNGEPLLTDFGLARALADVDHLTQEGTIVGTPAYIAPELIENGADCATPMSDIYSLGVMLYEALTGQKPFEGTPLVILHKATTTDPPPPCRLNRELDQKLAAIVLKTMAREPKKRYKSARALADALAEWTRADKTLPQRSAEIGQKSFRPSMRKWLWIAALLLLVGGSALAWKIVLYPKGLDGQTDSPKADTREPEVFVESPEEGQLVEGMVLVKGQVKDESEVTLRIQGNIVPVEANQFRYRLSGLEVPPRRQDKAYAIEITAQDRHGNKTRKIVMIRLHAFP